MIAVTGASGYLGGRILEHLRSRGIDAVALSREPQRVEDPARRYVLDEAIDPHLLDDVSCVVHAAYDFSVRGEAVARRNTVGSIPLLDEIERRHARLVFISSLAAFRDARSDYGHAKFELERLVLARGGIAVRPGLIFGRQAEGLFGQLEKAVGSRGLVPIVGTGAEPMYVSHDRALCALIAELALESTAHLAPIFAAHPNPTTVEQIARELGRRNRRSLRFVHVPWRLAYVALSAAESLGVNLPFRSDSLIGLRHTVPPSEIAELESSSVPFPPFESVLLS